MESITLTWTAAAVGLNPLLEYRIFRGVNGGARSFLIAVPAADPRTYVDVAVDGDANTYAYHIITRDTQGLDSDTSNIETLPFFRISEDGRPREVEETTDRRIVEEL
jgi:hypothetical protein